MVSDSSEGPVLLPTPQPAQREALLTDTLQGDALAEVNRVLRWHGIKEIGPCQVGEVLQHLTPMEAGRYSHIVGEVAAALAAVASGTASPA